jgi:hypothetical protein
MEVPRMLELDVQTFSAIAAVIGVTVGIALTFLELRHLRKERQTNLVTDLYSTFSSKEFQIAFAQIDNLEFKNAEDFLERYGPKANVEAWGKWQSEAAFFEQVGILLHRKLIDITLVDDLLSTAITQAWEKMAPIIKDRRERLGLPQIWEWFEYLYNEMKKRETKIQSTAQRSF